MVEYRVRRRLIVEMNQIHQRKREIVQDIRRRDNRIEFDGIEQQRLAIHQRNIGQMEIAMAAPHEPLPGALLEQCLERRDMIVAAGIELIDSGGVKSTHGTKFCGVAVDDAGNGGEPGFAIRHAAPFGATAGLSQQ